MSSTEQPSEHPQPARPVVYSGAEEQADHRLRSGFVPLITFAVIVAAAAVTAAVVFGGGAQTRSVTPTGAGLSHKPAAPAVAGSDSQGLVEAGTGTKATGPRPPRPRSRAVAATPAPPNAVGQVKVGIIPLTVAPGWKVKDQEGSGLVATSPLGDERIEIYDMPVLPENSIGDIFNELLKNYPEFMKNFSTEAPVDLGLKGKLYQESEEVKYSGIITDNGKEMTETGSVVVLLNPTTGDAAVINFYTWAGPQVLQANDADVRAMITSMLN